MLDRPVAMGSLSNICGFLPHRCSREVMEWGEKTVSAADCTKRMNGERVISRGRVQTCKGAMSTTMWPGRAWQPARSWACREEVKWTVKGKCIQGSPRSISVSSRTYKRDAAVDKTIHDLFASVCSYCNPSNPSASTDTVLRHVAYQPQAAAWTEAWRGRQSLLYFRQKMVG